MKKSTSKWMIALKTWSVCILLLLVLGISVSLTTNKILGDIWQQLGIKEAEANTDIVVSVMGEYFQYPGKKSNNLSQQTRLAVLNELIAYAKKYTGSAAFKKEYQDRRNISLPKKPDTSKVNVDSIKAVERKNIELDIKGTEANANNANPKVRNAVPYRLEQLKKDLKSIDDGTNRVVNYRINEMQGMNAAISRVYQQEIEKFNQRYPANPQDMIKRRLQDLLNITADVDFNAEVKENPTTKIKYFVNPDYQRKSKEWKLAFRAGKQLTDVARAAAEKWLSEMK